MERKKVLITGANSYIGQSFEKYANKNYEDYFEIETIDMIAPLWRKMDFSEYDSVFHVAGLAHADVGNVSEEIKKNIMRLIRIWLLKLLKNQKKMELGNLYS